MQNLKKNSQFYQRNEEQKANKSPKIFKKPSEIPSSRSSSSNEIVFLGDFPEENLHPEAFSYKEETKQPEFSKNDSLKEKPYSIKLSEGFTFVESFDYERFQSFLAYFFYLIFL